MNKMEIEFNTFNTFMKNWIGNNMNDSLTVTMERDRVMYGIPKINEKRMKPFEFT